MEQRNSDLKTCRSNLVPAVIYYIRSNVSIVVIVVVYCICSVATIVNVATIVTVAPGVS